MTTTTLYLVRHGEAERGEAESGEANDPSVTSHGLLQARSAGRALRSSAATLVLHGSKRRSVESAQALASSLDNADNAVTQSSDLFEDRTPIPENWSDVPEQYRSFLRSVPAGEADHGARRLTEAVHEMSRLESNDRTIVAVTHNFVIGWFVRSVLDAPWWRWIGLDQANGAITAIRWSHDRAPMLLSFNECGHLPDA